MSQRLSPAPDGEATRRRRCEMSTGPRRALPDRRAHELFEIQARERPEAIAAVHGDRQLTYGELNARANQLARALVARGVTREAVVGVMTERNLDWLTAVLAIFKAGGAYLPIEPHFPTERIAKMVSRAGAKLVLTQPLIEAAYEEGLAASDLGIAVARDQLAYIYFTSGSTGEPKGALCGGHRREPEEGPRRALVRGAAADQAGERVRPYRDVGRHQSRDHGPPAGGRARAAGPPHQQRAHRRRGRAPVTGGARRTR